VHGSCSGIFSDKLEVRASRMAPSHVLLLSQTAAEMRADVLLWPTADRLLLSRRRLLLLLLLPPRCCFAGGNASGHRRRPCTVADARPLRRCQTRPAAAACSSKHVSGDSTADGCIWPT
jgi:hypothetical protein